MGETSHILESVDPDYHEEDYYYLFCNSTQEYWHL